MLSIDVEVLYQIYRSILIDKKFIFYCCHYLIMIDLSQFTVNDLCEMLKREKRAMEHLYEYLKNNEYSKDIFNLIQTKKKNIQFLEAQIQERQSRNLN